MKKADMTITQQNKIKPIERLIHFIDLPVWVNPVGSIFPVAIEFHTGIFSLLIATDTAGDYPVSNHDNYWNYSESSHTCMVSLVLNHVLFMSFQGYREAGTDA